MSEYFEAEYSPEITARLHERERKEMEADATKYRELMRIKDNYRRARQAMIEVRLLIETTNGTN